MIKLFSIEALSLPETYADPELATLARQVARANFDTVAAGKMGRSEFKDAVLAGKYPELVFAAVQAEIDRQAREEAARSKGRAAAQAIQPPAGYSLTFEGSVIVLSGPFSNDLHTRIKRLGGEWDGVFGMSRKVWMIPEAKGSSLKRIFANFAQTAQAEAEARAELERKRAEERAARERQWAAERAARYAQQSSEPEVQRQARRLYPLSACPALNAPVRLGSSIVVFTGRGQPFRISGDHPSIHGSHLLGHEGERGCYVYYRPASDAEIQALEAREAEQQAKAAAEQDHRERRAALERAIVNQGETPDGSHLPAGDVFADTRTIYGTGSWFVVGPEWIWYCRNNGMDGDNWSANNVRTGGAGAIGWRIPHDAAIAAKIQCLTAGGDGHA